MFTFNILNETIKPVHPYFKFDLFVTALFPLSYRCFQFSWWFREFVFVLMQHLSYLLPSSFCIGFFSLNHNRFFLKLSFAFASVKAME